MTRPLRLLARALGWFCVAVAAVGLTLALTAGLAAVALDDLARGGRG